MKAYFEQNRSNKVYLVDAKVAGIHANNTLPAEFIYENLMIKFNVIHQAFKSGVKNFCS